MKMAKYLIAALFCIAAAYLIPKTFIYGDFITGNIDRVLHLRVDPRFSGGEVLAKFLDEMGDDYGEGGLTYPRHEGFKEKGCLDIVRYTVYEPLVNAPWSNEQDFWQIAITFANVSKAFDSIYDFSQPVIHVYIDIDGDIGGSKETAHSRAELIKFDDEHPWDFMVQIDGNHKSGRLISWDKTIEEKVSIYSVPEKKTIFARILLNNKRIKNVLDGRTTYHYVLTGAYDQYASGNFMQVKNKAGIRNGGGAKSKLTPRVFDYVAPKGYKQKKLLSSYDEDMYTYATVYPLEVKRTEQKYIQDADSIEKYRELARKENENRREASLRELEEIKASGNRGVELASAYFRVEKYKEAEDILDNILEKHPDNSRALAYKGSIIAIKGGECLATKSPAKAIGYVNTAYEYYDNAEIHAQNNEDIVVVLLNRGNLSISVPELVFQKSLQGAADFLNAAEILENSGSADKDLIISCYYNAATAYERAGKEDEAEIYLFRTLSFDDLSHSLRYELVKKGYVDE